MRDIPCKPLTELATQSLDGSTNDLFVTNRKVVGGYATP